MVHTGKVLFNAIAGHPSDYEREVTPVKEQCGLDHGARRWTWSSCYDACKS